jgi:hypothetical protein
MWDPETYEPTFVPGIFQTSEYTEKLLWGAANPGTARSDGLWGRSRSTQERLCRVAYAPFRQVGVPAAILKRAGIAESDFPIAPSRSRINTHKQRSGCSVRRATA